MSHSRHISLYSGEPTLVKRHHSTGFTAARIMSWQFSAMSNHLLPRARRVDTASICAFGLYCADIYELERNICLSNHRRLTHGSRGTWLSRRESGNGCLALGFSPVLFNY